MTARVRVFRDLRLHLKPELNILQRTPGNALGLPHLPNPSSGQRVLSVHLAICAQGLTGSSSQFIGLELAASSGRLLLSNAATNYSSAT